MKIYKINLMMCWLLIVAAAGSAQSLQGTIQQAIVDDVLNVDFLLTNTGAVPSDALGSASLEVTFNTAALVYIGKDPAQDGRWDDGTSSSYGDVFSYSAVNVAVLRIQYISGSGLDVPYSPTMVGRLSFTITDPSQISGVCWNTVFCSMLNTAGVPLSVNWLQPSDFDLPVEIITFTAESAQGVVNLQWSTASESENAGFFIYRADASDQPYQQINQKIIPGAGNSTHTIRYAFTDQTSEVGREYYYKLADVDYQGHVSLHGPIRISVNAPQVFILQQNYPNPFNPETTIRFTLIQDQVCELAVFNLTGQRIRTLASGLLFKGTHERVWDGRDDFNSPVATGSYLYILSTSSERQVRSMQLLR